MADVIVTKTYPAGYVDSPATTTAISAAALNADLYANLVAVAAQANLGVNTAVAGQTYADAKAITGVTATQTANFTAAVNKVNPVNAAAGGFTATLPSPVGIGGTPLVVTKLDLTVNAVTVSGLIDGAAGTIMLVGARSAADLVSDGTTWRTRTSTANLSPHGLPAYAPTGLKYRYDPTHNVYNWKPSNTRKLRAGHGLAVTGAIVNELVISDSTGAGCTSDVAPGFFDRLHAWPIAYRDRLANFNIPVGGSGFIRAIDGTYIDARSTFVGVWSGFQSCASTSVSGATWTIIPDIAATAVEVWYYGTSGAFTVALNGAASGPGFASVAAGSTAAWLRVVFTGVTITTASTITLTTTSTTAVTVLGMKFFNPDTGGLLVNNVSQSGSTASGSGLASWNDITDTGPGGAYLKVGGTFRSVTDGVTNSTTTVTSTAAAFTASDKGQRVFGTGIPANAYITAVASATSITISAAATATGSGLTLIFGTQPTAVHIALGVNDIDSAIAIATVTAAITAIRNRYPTADAILYVQYQPNLTTLANWQAYAAALFTLADTLDVPLVDLLDRSGGYTIAAANGLTGDTDAHLNRAGYEDWGRNIAIITAG